MTVTEQIVTIFIVALVTQLTRWIPFWVFRSSAHTPQYVNYLGRVLPPAIFGMLVVYCYKDIETRPYTDGFQKNNAKCLKSNGICSFVPYSSIDGF